MDGLGDTATAFGRQDLQSTCPETHTLKTYDTPNHGYWLHGSNASIGMLQQGNGAVKWRAQCRTCGAESSDIPISIIKMWHITTVEWSRVTAPSRYPPCVVRLCEQPGNEYHHFAPHSTFGNACDDWPALPLCHQHHFYWHQSMDGYRWHRKGIES